MLPVSTFMGGLALLSSVEEDLDRERNFLKSIVIAGTYGPINEWSRRALSEILLGRADYFVSLCCGIVVVSTISYHVLMMASLCFVHQSILQILRIYRIYFLTDGSKMPRKGPTSTITADGEVNIKYGSS